MKNLARVTALAVAACLLLGAFASSAMATETSAKFSASTIKLSGTGLTVKRGVETRTCEVPGGSVTGQTFESTILAYNDPTFYRFIMTCTGKTQLALGFYFASARYETTTGAYFLWLHSSETPQESPWGNYTPGYFGAPATPGWTNGAGATPSTINFKETLLGTLNSDGSKITLSGNLTATTSTGGLLTLSH
jgi:hypothetical protein